MSEPAVPPQGNVTFLFTDIEDSSRMTNALGNDVYLRQMREPHCARIRQAIADHCGYEVKTIGDSFMVAFDRADDAIACAAAIQQALPNPPIESTDPKGNLWTVKVRIGVHTAEQQLFPDDRGDYGGGDVNFASRVESLGAGEQILVSDSAHRAAGTEKRFEWKDWPNRRIKSFDQPETVWELKWDGESRGEPGSRWLPDWYGRDLNEFVGREALLMEVRSWLKGSKYPLFTLQGHGGIGKTRLAIETVLGVCGMFPGGVSFAALDREISGNPSTVTPEQLAAVLARAVEAPDDVAQAAHQQLPVWLKKQKPRLLVLDNWESVSNPSALQWLGELVQGARTMRYLVTSRVPMGLTTVGQTKHLPALAVPGRDGDAADLTSFEGYRLFATRARQHVEDHLLDDKGALVSILQATVGFPLGIELAAAQVVDYSLAEIAEGLKRSLLDVQRTPDGFAHLGPERHVSMEASIHWSVSLLPKGQQTAFHRLAVFPHDFSAAAAQEVCDVSDQWLRHWRRASLVDSAPAEGRFALLPVVREYAARRLGDKLKEWQQRFVAYFRQLAVDNGGQPNLSDHAKLAALTAEWRNAVAAAETAEALNDWEAVEYISAYLGESLLLRGLWSEREQLSLRAVTSAHASGNRQNEGIALNNLGNVYQAQGRWSDAEEAFQQSLTIAREFGDREGEGQTLNNLGVVYQRQGRWSEAEAAYQQDLAICREFGDRVGEGTTLMNIGNVCQAQGRWADAEVAFQQSLTIRREFGDRVGEGQTLNNLGGFYAQQDRWSEAEAAYQQSLTIFREFGDRVGEGKTLENLALLREAQGDVAGALVLEREASLVLQTTEDDAAKAKTRGLIEKWEKETEA